MPTLSAMVNRINQKTAFTFTPDEVIAALDESGIYVYQKVLKENRGFFIKVDETSLVLSPGQQGQDQTYDLPSDCTQILHLSERTANDPTCRWSPMEPTRIGKAYSEEWQNYVDYDGFGSGSRFKYAGPFLPASSLGGQIDPNDASIQTQQIAVTPTVDIPRATQLIYAAKWITLVDSSSPNILPEEGTRAQYNGALAILTGDIDDTRQGSYAQRAQMQLDAFLQWVADRQLQRGLTVKSYLL